MAESDPSLCFLTSASCFLSSRRQYKSRRVSEKRNSSLPGQSSSLATDSGDGSPHVAKRKTCRARLAPGLANQRIELLPRGRGDPLEHKRVVLGDHHKLNSGFKPELGTDGLGNHNLSSRGHFGGQRGHSLTSKTVARTPGSLQLARPRVRRSTPAAGGKHMGESSSSLCFPTSASCFLASRRPHKSRRVSEKRKLPSTRSSMGETPVLRVPTCIGKPAGSKAAQSRVTV